MLERQRINDTISCTSIMKGLLDIQAENSSIKSQGLAIANAKALADARKIEVQSEVDQAKATADSQKITEETDLELMRLEYEAELEFKKQMQEIEVSRQRELAQIEVKKFESTMDALGKDTIVEISRAGPELKAKLLKGLGLKGFFMTDGKCGVNLMQAADGMIGAPTPTHPGK